MAVELNHIIVSSRDKHASAAFLAGILGVEVGTAWGPFVPLPLSNGVTLDFLDTEQVHPQHCAFQLSEPEFEAALARLRSPLGLDLGGRLAGEYDRFAAGLVPDGPEPLLLDGIRFPFRRWNIGRRRRLFAGRRSVISGITSFRRWRANGLGAQVVRVLTLRTNHEPGDECRNRYQDDSCRG